MNCTFTSVTWGGSYKTELALSSGGKMYYGYGPIIGHGSGQALHNDRVVDGILR